MSGLDSATRPTRTGRIHFIDSLRGFTILSMVLFHLCYDLRFINGLQVPFFRPPFMDVWRDSISWTFLFVAGLMFAQSHDNARRGVKYLIVGLAVRFATTVADVDVPVRFGIFFCMGASTLTCLMLDRLRLLPRSVTACIALAGAFLLILNINSGYIGIGNWAVRLPGELYSWGGLTWFGFPSPTFESGDYYPLLPYLLVYLSGATLGKHMSETGGCPSWMYSQGPQWLEFLGRHTIVVYLLHQPIILLALGDLL